MATGLYFPLDSSRREIRLLTIFPSNDFDSRIECQLLAKSLDDGIAYEAMSYCWGAPIFAEMILVNGFEVRTTNNLHQGLRHFRSHGIAKAELPTWIDAVCINQCDVDERGSQVSMMSSIYREAVRVHIWLGGPSVVPKEAMRALAGLNEAATRNSQYVIHGGSASDDHLDRLERWPRSDSEEGLQDLRDILLIMRNPYWRRTWVLQEAAAAIRCSIHGNDGQVVLLGFENDQIPGRPGDETALADPRYFDQTMPFVQIDYIMRVHDTDTWQFASLLEECRSALGPLAYASWSDACIGDPQRAIDDYLLINRAARDTIASDARDKVFGIMGLMPGLGLSPDYTLPMQDVYIEATRRFIQTHKTLEILTGACSGDPLLPSWVPDYRVPCSDKDWVLYNASATRLGAHAAFHAPGVLTSWGLEIDRIAGFDRSRAHEGNVSIKEHVLQRQNLYYQRAFPSSSTPRDTTGTDFDFWRIACPDLSTMTGDDPHMAIVALSRAFEHQRLEQAEHASQDAMHTISKSLRDFDFFVTANGNAGTLHRGLAAIEDSIIILAGAPTPFCARRVSMSSWNKFALKSACFVERSVSFETMNSACSIMHRGAVYERAGMSMSDLESPRDPEETRKRAQVAVEQMIWDEFEIV
ncbi:unnamed protein product [Zymoseptoria tritici ST99CH_1E4]|uniref:Heterokaryon incompatibility domain-containing protein n=1 Tax=Zymoseptoria tritici ST99CH_1E4 TaxID=1276532 RepID=A0A2H1H3J6_ZYMTR|nr:unnamed protein product [Zymoseptoria tritici ST99CH_1E4]